MSEQALQLSIRDYSAALPPARSGAALAVKACASFFGGDMLMIALHFLLEHGLADVAHVPDQKATVSEQMMQAGEPEQLAAGANHTRHSGHLAVHDQHLTPECSLTS